MRFQVPQFIGVEDKIFGPLTAKQFVYVVGGCGLCFVAYKYVPFFIAIFIIIPVFALAMALAFYKMNGKPFVFILEASVKYFLKNKFYVWKKEIQKPGKKKGEKNEVENTSLFVPKLSESHLKDISWNLDVKKNLDKYGKEREGL